LTRPGPISAARVIRERSGIRAREAGTDAGGVRLPTQANTGLEWGTVV